MKRTLLVALVALLSCGFVFAEGGQERDGAMPADKADGSGYTLGLCMLGMNAPYYAGMVAGFEAEVAAAGATALVTDAQWVMEKQVSDFEDLLSKGVDAIVLNPLDPVALVPLTRRAASEGVPVFVIDSGISDDAAYVSRIASDSPNNGQMLGQWLVGELGEDAINMVVMSGSRGSVEGQTRRLNMIAGAIEAQMKAMNRSNFKVVTQAWGDWAHEGGLSAMEDVLVAHAGEFNVLFAENDAMALGALRAIEEAGLQDDVIVMAVDGQREAPERIIAGEYDATAINNPNLLASTAVQFALRYLGGEQELPKQYRTPPAVITIDNVEEFYDPNSVF
jgi:ribose transport system substrate-binding protein